MPLQKLPLSNWPTALQPSKQGTIFWNCAIPSITHLLAANVFHHADLTTPANPFLWCSAFTDTITMTTELFICKLTQQNQLPPESHHLLALSIPFSGCGFWDPTTFAISAYLLHFTWSLRYATLGLHHNNYALITLPAIHNFALANWATSNQCCHQIFWHYTPTIVPLVPNAKPQNLPNLANFIRHTPLKGLSHHLYHTHQHKIHESLLMAPPPLHSRLYCHLYSRH